MVITMCYTWGDMEAISKTPTGYPFIQIFYDTTQSRAAATVMTLLVILPLLGSAIAVTAAASRQIWSFARDKGPPLSAFISWVS